MEQNIKRGRGHLWAGLFLLAVGGVLLLRAVGVFFPYWLFTWPVILIVIGLFIGLRHNFRGPAWFILIAVGCGFLLDDAFPDVAVRQYILPLVVIAMGIFFIMRPWRHRRRRFQNQWEEGYEGQRSIPENQPVGSSVSAATSDYAANANDYIDLTTAFGGVRRAVISKNFKGGEILTFMGGADIDLRQADFSHAITIDATNIFGGTKLLVPASWDVQSEIVAIFGGVDDKRQVNAQAIDHNKVLRLEGTCLFGGVEIRSF